MTKDAAKAGQVSKSAAEIYDEFFVPSLFGQWAAPLCDAAQISPHHAVLDVACGTGATTREAAARLSPNGSIVGLDRNDGMLAVAQSRAPHIEWIEGLAEKLPLDDGQFDVVLCQFGLMFLDNSNEALDQMQRVLRPGGRVAVSVWDKAENSPGYHGMIELIEEMFGETAANALRAPFVLGEERVFRSVLDEGGLTGAIITTRQGTARFPSIREWARTDVRGWTLTEFIDEAGFEALVEEAERNLNQFAGNNGSVEFPAPAHIAVWTSA